MKTVKTTEFITVQGVQLTLSGSWSDDTFEVESIEAQGCIMELLAHAQPWRACEKALKDLEEQHTECLDDSWEYTKGDA